MTELTPYYTCVASRTLVPPRRYDTPRLDTGWTVVCVYVSYTTAKGDDGDDGDELQPLAKSRKL
jgi:hypothetical protein